ncbi:ROK family transcriptional regulator [Uliginosibacterium sediminicola]|uniref:ROK family transcriptional regulator n=1 Tax=Uliginosibacterium sediminicola TaxID=2024550 RepID=A0ABU9YXJ7_9RHOO
MVITGNQQLVKRLNQLAILRAVRAHPGISRSEVASVVRLTKSTIGHLVEALIEEGWLDESPTPTPTHTGRRPTPLHLDQTRKFVLGASINNQQIELVATSLRGELRETFLAPADRELGTVLDTLAALITRFAATLDPARQQIVGIGLGVPGTVDEARGVLRYSEQTGWHDAPIRDMLHARLADAGLHRLPLILERAVNCTAFLHFEREKIEGEGPLLYVHVGEGVAASVVAHQRILRGHNGVAGSIAHLQMQADGPLCRCGQRGCANTLMSLPAMCAAFGQDLAALEAASAAGEVAAHAVQREAGSQLGRLLADLDRLFDPSHILVGGPAFRLSGPYLASAQAMLSACARRHSAAKTIKLVSLAHNTLALGAAAAALHVLLSCPIEREALETAPTSLSILA